MKNLLVTPLLDIRKNKRVIGLVQGTWATYTVVPMVAPATNAILIGSNYPWPSTINQRDILSHIERSRNIKVSVLVESL